MKAKTPRSFTPVKADLEKLFSSIAEEMASSFKTMASVSHAPTRGSGHEAIWGDWLKKYLPQRYAVAAPGFIIDSKGNQSLQQDLIIFDRQYSPLLLNKDEVLFVPAEAVYAVVEVKSNLTPAELRDAIKKIASSKELLRTPAQAVIHAGGVFPPKERGQIFGYVVAGTSSWKDRVRVETLAKLSGESPNILDGGCILDGAAFSVQYSDEKTAIKSVDGGQALFGFLALLVEDLKPLGTTPPWDLALYSSTSRALRREPAVAGRPRGAKRAKLS